MSFALGIDVARYQAASDWSPLGLSFVIAKASQGTFSDPNFYAHRAKARANGLVFGAYHYNDARIDAHLQARYFLEHSADADLLFLDVEGRTDDPRRFYQDETRSFIDEVHRAGRRIGLYMSASGFYTTTGQDFNWVAKWSPGAPALPWAFWQFDGSGADGIDNDYFNGSAAELHAFLGGDMVYTKPAQTIGTVAVKGTGHKLVSSVDPKGTRWPVADGTVLNVVAVVNLVAKGGAPIDIDGNQPPVNGRDQVYLVDRAGFDESPFALRADCGPLTLPADPTPYNGADLVNSYNAGVTAASQAALAARK
jgi:lysozyme